MAYYPQNPNGATGASNSAPVVIAGDQAAISIDDNGGSLTVDIPPTAGNAGCEVYRNIDIDENQQPVKLTGGNLYGYFAHNASSSTLYIHIYNGATAAITVGTTTPTLTFPVPSGASANVGFAYPIHFDTAISVAAVAWLTGATAPATNDCIVNVFYK